MNVFEQQAHRQSNGAQRAQWRREEKVEARRAAQPMKPSPLEQKVYDKREQLARYRKWKIEVRQALERGDYGPEVIALLKILRSPKARDLVAYVQGAKWMQQCTRDVRLTLLGYINHAITRHRIRNGYPPMDDPIPSFDGTPDPPENAFLIIRRLLTQD